MRRNPLVLVVVSMVVAAILTGGLTFQVWPGELALTAPLLCPADQPDAFVVEDRERRRGGTAINHTLYCLGPTGAFTDAGFWRPLLVVYAAHTLLVIVLTLLAALVIANALKLRPTRPA